MTMEIVPIGLTELRSLIGTPTSGTIRVGSTLKCVCAIDLFTEVERIKKRNLSHSTLRIIRERKCMYYEACEKGYVLTAVLDEDAIKDGLFEIVDDFFNAEFWSPAIDPNRDPAYSSRIVALKSYDNIYGTQFHLQISESL